MKPVINAYWNSYTPRGQFWLALGLLMLAVDAALSFAYGITQTTLHGIGFALVAVMFALLPDAAREEWEHGRKVGAICLALLCVPIGAVAYYSHIGYGAGVRVGDIQRATVVNARHQDTRDSVQEARTNLAMFSKRLADLEQQNTWVPTVTADGVRAEIATKDEAIRQEERRGGCGPRCLVLKQERAALEARRGTVEQRSDLTERIAAARAVVDRAREASAKTQTMQSSVVNQNHVGAQLWLAVNGQDASKAIHPDEVTTSYVNLLVAGAGALAFMLLAPIGMYMAGRNRITSTTMLPSAPAGPDVSELTMPAAFVVPPIEQRFAPPPARSPTVRTATIAELRQRLLAA